MRFLAALCLLLLLASCANQHREPSEPDFSVDPGTQPTEPELSEVERLMRGAKRDAAAGDEGEARIKLHQVFRRDRWHPEANTLYQDLKIKLGQGDALYQEYLDLYEKNKQRGDALWFHLRPLLIKRGIKAYPLESRPALTDQQQARIREIEDLPRPEGSEKARLDEELKRLDELLALDPMRDDWLRQRAYLAPEGTAKKFRELFEENPSSGDFLYLYAMGVFLHEVGPAGELKALNILREGWILELPGYHLLEGMAHIAYEKISYDLEPAGIPRIEGLLDKSSGLLNIALNFYRLAALTAPFKDYSADIQRVQDLAQRHKRPLEDLAQRK